MQTGYNPERQPKGFTVVYILIGTLVIAGAIVAGAYLIKQTVNFQPEATNPATQPIPTTKYPSDTIPLPTGADETDNWITYKDNTYNYVIRYPQDWILINSKDYDGNPQIRLKIINTEKAKFSARELPEIYIGLTSPYSTAGVVCANQACDEIKNETVKMEGKNYTFSIIKASGGVQIPQFDFYAFTFSIDHKKINMIGYSEPISLNVYSSFKTQEEEKIILKILSTFKFLDQKAASKDCKPTGCSGQICSDENVTTTCEFLAQYGCYTTARCERQTDGRCGWTSTEELNKCLSKFQSK